MKRQKLYWLIFILIIACLVFLAIFYKDPTTKPLKIIMLNVGQGDSIYIETPNGTNMLIDAGRDRAVLHELGNVINKNKIDIMEISNPDLDHMGGFPFVMEKYSVGRILSSGTNHDSVESFNKIEELAKQNKIGIEKPKAGTVYVIDKENNITYTILWPEGNVREWDSNPGSMIGLIQYGDKKILMTGDAPKEVEDQVLAKYQNSLQNIDILKVGHHGSRTSTGENLVNTAKPVYALISAGLNNRYGHPHKEVLQNLEKVNANILVTSTAQTIECTVIPEIPVFCK